MNALVLYVSRELSGKAITENVLQQMLTALSLFLNKPVQTSVAQSDQPNAPTGFPSTPALLYSLYGLVFAR